MDDVIALKQENEKLKREKAVLEGRMRELEAANRSLAKATTTGSPASVLKHTRFRSNNQEMK